MEGVLIKFQVAGNTVLAPSEPGSELKDPEK
jgi:hypothetical protein